LKVKTAFIEPGSPWENGYVIFLGLPKRGKAYRWRNTEVF